MKTLYSFVLLFASLFVPAGAGANPIIERFFTELKFDANGWKLEMHPSRSWLLDGWSLQSNSGTAYFKSGIRIDTGYVVITRDSLLAPLSINPAEDRLALNSAQGMTVATLSFSATNPARLAAPRPGQSLCVTHDGDYYWYLDNTPTLGRRNDFLNAIGTVRGVVRNTAGSPIRNVRVQYDQDPFGTVYTDAAGQFQFSLPARSNTTSFSCPGYVTAARTFQIWPESTVTFNLTLTQTVIYPLHTGDQWNWGSVRYREVTGDTTLPNGQTYAKIFDPRTPATIYQRYSDDRVYQYGLIIANQQQLLYDFSRSPGDTIATIYRPTDTTDIIHTGYGEAILFGSARRQWGFLIDVRRRIDEELYQVITDSIGVTHEETVWGSADLLGARINGITYGTIADLDERREPSYRFKLHDNYPNPFNPGTTLHYEIPHRSHVSLKVFDVLGREVAKLVDTIQEAGAHSYLWTIDDVQLSTGLYFCHLQVGSFVATRKMILMR